MMTATKKREGGVEPNLGKKRWSQTFEKKPSTGCRARGFGVKRCWWRGELGPGKFSGLGFRGIGFPMEDLNPVP